MSAQANTSYGTRFRFEGSDGQVYSGSGSPEGVQTGSVGDWYLRTDATSIAAALYYKLTGTATTTGWTALDPTGATTTVEAVTTAKSPTAAESGEVYTNEGDTDGSLISLPTAVAGLRFGFYVQAAYVLQIAANTGDTIRLGTQVTAAGGSITSDVVGSYVQLLAVNATEWVATAILGEWTL
jgi:hypothetical protein